MHRLVVFRLAHQTYALPLEAVEQAVSMVAVAPLAHVPDIVLGVVNIHGRIVPVIDLHRRFGLSVRSYGPEATLVIVRTARRMIAVPVDEVLGIRLLGDDLIARPAAIFPGVERLSGVAALPDGILLIHDPDACLSPGEERRLTEALECDRP